MSSSCPACQKWPAWDGSCGKCPLAPFCCNGLWQKFNTYPTKENAQAVLAYIEQKLEEARQAEKCKKEWVPKLGDKVGIHKDSTLHGYASFMGANPGGTVVARDAQIHGGRYLVFNPVWSFGHAGHHDTVWGNPVPGYGTSHWWVDLANLYFYPEDSK